MKKMIYLALLITVLTSCAAIKFITDAAKAHFKNNSDYVVEITCITDDKSFEIMVKPGENKMISIKRSDTMRWKSKGPVAMKYRSKSWYDQYWKMERTDHYYTFSNK